MNTTWDRLSPKQLSRRADTVLQYARSMPGGVMDNFSTAERLTDLLRDVDPAEVDRCISDCRQKIKNGELTPNAAVEQLMTRCVRSAASNREGRLLSAAFHRCLASNRPLAAIFAETAGEDGDLDNYADAGAPLIGLPNPDPNSYARLPAREAERLRRDQQRLAFSRDHRGETMPDFMDYTPREVKEGAKLAAKRGISFDAAVQLLRNGR